jgi:hypothetical protein
VLLAALADWAPATMTDPVINVPTINVITTSTVVNRENGGIKREGTNLAQVFPPDATS